MNINRLLFLSLASSLSALACSSATEVDTGSDEGAATLQDCSDPGTTTARVADTHVNFCNDFASRAAAKGDHYASVYGQCMTQATRYRSNAANAAIACLRSGESRNESTWQNVYTCGYTSLSKHCGDADRFASKCTELVRVLKSSGRPVFTQANQSDDESLVTECQGYLGALDSDAVSEIEKCVREANLSVSSCVEGLDLKPGRGCTSPTPGARVPGLKQTCERVFEVSSADEGEMNVQTCLGIGVRLLAGPANTFVEQVAAAIEQAKAPGGKPIGNYDLTQIGGRVIRDICPNTQVDAACKQIVESSVAAGLNNRGGRLTKECRQILAAVDQNGASQLRSCNRVQRQLGAGRGAELVSLYWCMGNLRATPSEIDRLP